MIGHIFTSVVTALAVAACLWSAKYLRHRHQRQVERETACLRRVHAAMTARPLILVRAGSEVAHAR